MAISYSSHRKLIQSAVGKVVKKAWGEKPTMGTQVLGLSPRGLQPSRSLFVCLSGHPCNGGAYFSLVLARMTLAAVGQNSNPNWLKQKTSRSFMTGNVSFRLSWIQGSKELPRPLSLPRSLSLSSSSLASWRHDLGQRGFLHKPHDLMKTHSTRASSQLNQLTSSQRRL